MIKAEAEVAAGIERSVRLRAPGGGDRPLIEKQPGLLDALGELIRARIPSTTFVATARSSETPIEPHRLLGEMRAATLDVLPLDGLDRNDVSRLVELRVGQLSPDAVAHQLTTQTAGNPFFLSLDLDMVVEDRLAQRNGPSRRTKRRP